MQVLSQHQHSHLIQELYQLVSDSQLSQCLDQPTQHRIQKLFSEHKNAMNQFRYTNSSQQIVSSQSRPTDSNNISHDTSKTLLKHTSHHSSANSQNQKHKTQIQEITQLNQLYNDQFSSLFHSEEEEQRGNEDNSLKQIHSINNSNRCSANVNNLNIKDIGFEEMNLKRKKKFNAVKTTNNKENEGRIIHNPNSNGAAKHSWIALKKTVQKCAQSQLLNVNNKKASTEKLIKYKVQRQTQEHNFKRQTSSSSFNFIKSKSKTHTKITPLKANLQRSSSKQHFNKTHNYQQSKFNSSVNSAFNSNVKKSKSKEKKLVVSNSKCYLQKSINIKQSGKSTCKQSLESTTKRQLKSFSNLQFSTEKVQHNLNVGKHKQKKQQLKEKFEGEPKQDFLLYNLNNNLKEDYLFEDIEINEEGIIRQRNLTCFKNKRRVNTQANDKNIHSQQKRQNIKHMSSVDYLHEIIVQINAQQSAIKTQKFRIEEQVMELKRQLSLEKKLLTQICGQNEQMANQLHKAKSSLGLNSTQELLKERVELQKQIKKLSQRYKQSQSVYKKITKQQIPQQQQLISMYNNVIQELKQEIKEQTRMKSQIKMKSQKQSKLLQSKQQRFNSTFQSNKKIKSGLSQLFREWGGNWG